MAARITVDPQARRLDPRQVKEMRILMEQLRLRARSRLASPLVCYGIPAAATVALGPLAAPLFLPGLVIHARAVNRENAVINRINALAQSEPAKKAEMETALENALGDGTIGPYEVKRLFKWRTFLGMGAGRKISSPLLRLQATLLMKPLTLPALCVGVIATAALTLILLPVAGYLAALLPLAAVLYGAYREASFITTLRSAAQVTKKNIEARLNPSPPYPDNDDGLRRAQDDLAMLKKCRPERLGQDFSNRVQLRMDELEQEIIPRIEAALNLSKVLQGQVGQGEGRYTLEEVIGVGGMGIVYKAKDRNGRLVAVKVLKEEEVPNKEIYDRFVKEPKLLMEIQSREPCPFVVAAIDFGTTNKKIKGIDQPFFVMEYVEGPSLRDLIDAGELSHDRAVNLVWQLARGLQAINGASPGKEYVHRDIKPENVIVTKGPDGKSDVAKIIDLGLVKDPSDPRTRTGTAMGSINYMAPESQQKDAVDHRTDIYALGILFYQMLTGRLPHDINTNLNRFISFIRDVKLDRPQPFDYTNIPRYRAIIQKMTHPDKNKRHATYEALLKDLKDIREAKTPTPGEKSSLVVIFTLGDSAIIGTQEEFDALMNLKVETITDPTVARTHIERIEYILERLEPAEPEYQPLSAKRNELHARYNALLLPPPPSPQEREQVISFLEGIAYNPCPAPSEIARLAEIQKQYVNDPEVEEAIAAAKVVHGIS